MPDTRRRPVVILLFLIASWDDARIDEYESRLAFVKSRYRDLTTKGKEEFLSAYWRVALARHTFGDPNQYFAALSDDDTERARLHFLDRFSKDDYVEEIARKLKLNEAQIDSFKSSLEAVARSGKFDIDHLKEFIRKRSHYRKLFVVTSDTKLPKRLQSYITQNPYFILNWSSIANLPRIGLSRRFDIFFYAPKELIPSAEAALRRFAEIDPSVSEHPIRIYEVDPAQAASAALEKGPHFAQAIRYFESSAIDTLKMGDLSYPQLLSVFEAANVSLKDLLRELPIAEFSSQAYPEEKPFLDKIFRAVVTKGGNVDIFRAMGATKTVRKRVLATKTMPVQYEASHSSEAFGSKVTLPKFKSRLSAIAGEIVGNIEAVNATLI
jgi:ethanolamine utilization protein EutP (predicted NTPase)